MIIVQKCSKEIAKEESRNNLNVTIERKRLKFSFLYLYTPGKMGISALLFYSMSKGKFPIFELHFILLIK